MKAGVHGQFWPLQDKRKFHWHSIKDASNHIQKHHDQEKIKLNKVHT